MSFRTLALTLAVAAMPAVAAAQTVYEGPRDAKELRVAQIEIRKPQIGKPESEKPRNVKPEIVKPEDKKPEIVKPQGGKPEIVKPEDKKPELVKPQGGKPEIVKPQGKKPEFVKPQGGKPEIVKPQDKKPEFRRPDGNKGIPANMPSAQQIEKMLQAAPGKRIRPEERVHIREFKKRPDLRRIAPSIDIQSINFAFGSAEIPYSQFDKVENIAEAMQRILRRNPREVFLIEGHTDAVGSYESNQRLSEARAASLKRVLVNEFGVPRRALETVGYGEEFLLVPTQDENWQNRRVTLRRITDQVIVD